MEPTREIFGNIAPWMRALFYLLIAGSLAWMGQQIARRFLLWKNGSKGSLERDWRIWISRFLTFVLAQKKVHRKSLGAFLHACLFSGFVILFVGTTLLFMADKGPVNFHHGLYYLGYELTMDVFGVAFCFGCILAMYRRFAARPSSLGHNPRDWFLLSLLLSIGASGFLLEALRIGYTGVDSETARWSTVGWILSSALAHVLDSNGARTLHLITWWTHVALILAFFVYLPASRFLHVITGTLNILLRPSRAMGVPAIVTMDDVERTGRIGVSAMGHFTQQQLLSLDACMECGRCEDACPAYATHKPLSPKAVVLDLKELHGARQRSTPR